jgi:hypothetical protein
LVLLMFVGCSKRSPDSGPSKSSNRAPVAVHKRVLSDTDKKSDEIARSPDTKEARAWLKENPKAVFSTAGLDGNVLLAPTVARIYQAGAQRVYIQSTANGVLTDMVVLLPATAAARQKLFELDAELSPLREQTAVADTGQKYLHYGFQ